MQQRKHVRVPFTGTAEIPTEKPPIKVTVSNVSFGGLHLYCPKPFDLGQQVTLRIRGNHSGRSFNETVEGRVVVVHRRPDGNSYGVQFSSYLDMERHPGLAGWVGDMVKKVGAVSFLRNLGA